MSRSTWTTWHTESRRTLYILPRLLKEHQAEERAGCGDRVILVQLYGCFCSQGREENTASRLYDKL